MKDIGLFGYVVLALIFGILGLMVFLGYEASKQEKHHAEQRQACLDRGGWPWRNRTETYCLDRKAFK